ncbi:mycothiol conjugate amidase Mca [Galactobacter sp.]|uniref:mycothiol conjugate amidase Mca n=1 Tax=Galactobacter sp. TaxID=2676125 RepID=UPI0025B9D6C0|nr:mycothiol conjugate amidase Mca [Galactobacter sp.]
MTEQLDAELTSEGAASIPDATGLRVMAVHAHPDDEASKGAAATAAYVAAGAEVMVVSCTGGERGDILVSSAREVARAHRDLAGLRRDEMAASVAALGVQHRWLGFVDSGLPEGDPLPPLPFGSFASLPLSTTAAPLVRLVRTFRPHVILTYDENGGYPHPDHIRCHEVSVEAFRAAGNPEEYPGLGEPWNVSKIYYDRGFAPEKFRALHEGLLDAGLESPFDARLARAVERENQGDGWAVRHQTTTRIPVATFLDRRDAALLAHRTQVDPDGFFFAVPAALAAKIYPWEDYTLAFTRVATDLPETDLFAGLHDGVGERIGRSKAAPQPFRPGGSDLVLDDSGN